ncbi:unnamed protein product, partial [Symbiodinium sp. CCMP2456]
MAAQPAGAAPAAQPSGAAPAAQPSADKSKGRHGLLRPEQIQNSQELCLEQVYGRLLAATGIPG